MFLKPEKLQNHSNAEGKVKEKRQERGEGKEKNEKKKQ